MGGRSWWWVAALAMGCDESLAEVIVKDASVADASRAKDASPAKDDAKPARPDASVKIEGLTLRSDITPITRAEDAMPGTFIPPFVSCVAPMAGEPAGKGPDGKVCTNVAISGSTEADRSFAEYGDCSVVKTQRPFWNRPPAGETDPNDPRLNDEAYLKELGWVTAQVKTTGCVCCHDSKVLGEQAGQWDIQLGPLWLDSLSDTGLALFAGLADSSVLGAYHPADNNGFDRNVVGIPTDDNARMQKFMFEELARRGISQDDARAVPPFGGPIYQNRVAKPEPCDAEQRVSADGTISWGKASARYVYVMSADSANPGVPPNLDTPDGTIFRLDVLASHAPVLSGVAYGTTPEGTFQAFPEAERAAALQAGTQYHLYVLKDVGLPVANCLFTFGEDPPPVMEVDAGMTMPTTNDAGACTLAGGDSEGFGAPCKDGEGSSDCPCAANYCAIQPGQTTGYCTKQGCNTDPKLCPSGYSCLDLSRFAPGLPAICSK